MVPNQFRLNQLRADQKNKKNQNKITDKIQFTLEHFMKHSEAVKKIKNILL